MIRRLVAAFTRRESDPAYAELEARLEAVQQDLDDASAANARFRETCTCRDESRSMADLVDEQAYEIDRLRAENVKLLEGFGGREEFLRERETSRKLAGEVARLTYASIAADRGRR